MNAGLVTFQVILVEPSSAGLTEYQELLLGVHLNPVGEADVADQDLGLLGPEVELDDPA